MRRWIALGLMACMSVGLYWHFYVQGSSTNDNVSADDWLKSVTVETVQPKNISGHLIVEAHVAADADRMTPVVLPLSGRVVSLSVAAGDVVKSGQTLALIESADFAQNLSDLHTARASEHQAQAILKRKQVLHDNHSIADAEWEQAQTDAANAEAAWAAAAQRARVMGLTEKEIAEYADKEPVHALWPLRAPLAGVVLERALAPNQFVSSGNTVLNVAQLSDVWVVGDIAETAASSVRVGMRTEVTLSADGSKRVSTLNYVGGAIDPVTHRLAVRAVLANADSRLKPEMLASMDIQLGSPESRLAIPDSAIIYEDGLAHVWVVNEQKQLQYRTIEVGVRESGWVAVIKGLKGGEKIVTRGGIFIDRSVDTSGQKS